MKSNKNNMKTMITQPNIELKNVKTFRGMEGHGLNADIYINGIKCMFVIDEGNGGSYNYQSYAYNNPQAEIINQSIELLKKYVDSLPDIEITIEGEKHKIKQDLDIFIDELFTNQQRDAFKNKMLKKQSTCIIYGKPDSDSYSYIDFKRPLKDIDPDYLKKYIEKVKTTHCKNGIEILNTNL